MSDKLLECIRVMRESNESDSFTTLFNKIKDIVEPYGVRIYNPEDNKIKLVRSITDMRYNVYSSTSTIEIIDGKYNVTMKDYDGNEKEITFDSESSLLDGINEVLPGSGKPTKLRKTPGVSFR